MNITSAQRQANDPLTNEERTDLIVVIDGVEMYVPIDPANRHYAEIMRQVEAGQLTIEDAD
jgi:hypothetical protein